MKDGLIFIVVVLISIDAMAIDGSSTGRVAVEPATGKYYSSEVRAIEERSIESHFNPVNGRLINVMAPCAPGCYIEIDIGEGSVISSPTSGVDWEKLYSFEDTSSKSMTLMYSFHEGAFAIHDASETKILLTGPLEMHPIDLALSNCFSDPVNETTSGIVICYGYAFDAWNIELNRVYKNLGGSENTELRAAQLAWIKYRDAQFTWYSTSFLTGKQGSKWKIGIAERKVEVVRSQVEQLQSYYKGH